MKRIAVKKIEGKNREIIPQNHWYKYIAAYAAKRDGLLSSYDKYYFASASLKNDHCRWSRRASDAIAVSRGEIVRHPPLIATTAAAFRLYSIIVR